LETLLHDIKHGCRLLLRNPAFTVVVMLALALGIGANTAVFSVMNAVLLKPLPYKNSDMERNMIKTNLDNLSNTKSLIDDYHNKTVKEKTVLTMETGIPIDDNFNSMTAGERGPILLQDTYLLEKLQHFTRERIPERVVHARGTGCYGYFEYTDDISNYCKAKLFHKENLGQQTPLFCRFSLVMITKGEPETSRDIRGFALKIYTEEGNWDLLGNNVPIFPIRNPIKMNDLAHVMKKHPQTNLYDADSYWDFFSQTPEALHCLTLMYDDKGMTDGYRKMHGFSNHTFRMVNNNNEVHYVKFSWMSHQGLHGLNLQETIRISGEDPDYYTRDLYDNIGKGNFPTWTFCMQVMPEKDALNYKYDIFDVTKVWPHADFPLINIGKIVLNKLPNNFFMESEQAAFNPSSMIPGIEPTPDKLLQARLFVYRDAQLYRLGTPNYNQISVNCPFRAHVSNHERDGLFTTASGGGTGFPHYDPSSYGGPKADQKYRLTPYEIKGPVGRFPSNQLSNDDYEQCNLFYTKVLDDKRRDNLVKNICSFLCKAKQEFQMKQTLLFYKVNPDYGLRVAKCLGLQDLVTKFQQTQS